MKFAFLGSSENWHIRDLKRAARNVHTIVPVSFCDIHAMLCNGNDRSDVQAVQSRTSEKNKFQTVHFDQFDAVLVRSMPAGTLEQIVFRMDVLGRLAACGMPILNSPKAMEASVDKFLTTAHLQSSGLVVPRTWVGQNAADALTAFNNFGEDAVIKPLFGGEGRGIERLQSVDKATRKFRELEERGSVIYLQEYIPHRGEDYRLLVVGDTVLGMRRVNRNDWRTNISRGASAEPLHVTPQLSKLAKRAAKAVGAEFAGVDLLPGNDGELYTLEVNAAPGWKALSGVVDSDVASLLLELLVSMKQK